MEALTTGAVAFTTLVVVNSLTCQLTKPLM